MDKYKVINNKEIIKCKDCNKNFDISKEIRKECIRNELSDKMGKIIERDMLNAILKQ